MAYSHSNPRPGKVKDLTGQTFGLFVVIGLSETRSNTGRLLWACQCKCGNLKDVIGNNLVRGLSTNCGHLNTERFLKMISKHDKCTTKEYRSWQHAKARCSNESDAAYADYGGRGITMCERWKDSFQAFYDDMGPCPDGMSIDRIEVNGNYEPGNCRWATQLVQVNNQRRTIRITHDGELITLKELERRVGIPYGTLLERYHMGRPLLGRGRNGLRQRL